MTDYSHSYRHCVFWGLINFYSFNDGIAWPLNTLTQNSILGFAKLMLCPTRLHITKNINLEFQTSHLKHSLSFALEIKSFHDFKMFLHN